MAFEPAPISKSACQRGIKARWGLKPLSLGGSRRLARPGEGMEPDVTESYRSFGPFV